MLYAKYEKESSCTQTKVSESSLCNLLLEIINKQVELVLLDGRNPSDFTLTNHEKVSSLQTDILAKQNEHEKFRVLRKQAFEEYCFEQITKAKYTMLLDTYTHQAAAISARLQELQAECFEIVASREASIRKSIKNMPWQIN